MSAASIELHVEIVGINGHVLEDPTHTYGVTMAGKQIEDQFAGLCARDGKAQVEMGVTEKLPGPRNSYSLISVSAKVTLRCDQTTEAIRAAGDAAFNEAYRQVDQCMEVGVVLLAAHLDKHGWGS